MRPVRAPLVEVDLITPLDASMAGGYLLRLIKILPVLGSSQSALAGVLLAYDEMKGEVMP